MKIKLENLNEEVFKKRTHVVSGELVHLICPSHVGVDWSDSTLHLRSSVWDDEGNLISAGFPKFFNWGERPMLSPVPVSLKSAEVVEKMDGSLFIVSKFKNNFILRTRGTIDASGLDNGDEVSIFKNEYLPYCNELDSSETWDFSLLFEWVSSRCKIVISYENCPRWILIGGIRHKDYSLFLQSELNDIATRFAWDRPRTFKFSTVSELLNTVETFDDTEGVVVYTKNGQVIHKCKSAWYLKLHHLKSELSSLEKVLDVWLYKKRPSYVDFYNYISNTFDFELAEFIRGHISNIIDASKEVDSILNYMAEFVNLRVKPLKDRKSQADLILSSYGDTNRASYLFKLLDGSEITDDHYKKLMFQVMK